MRSIRFEPAAAHIAVVCLLIAVVFLAAGFDIATVAAQDSIRIREDIETVAANPAKLKALQLAFQTLRVSTDATKNLRFWANIHGAVPPETSTGPCIHQEEGIWAWHRSFLWGFENALRNSHPPETSEVTLPFWNWTAPPSGQRYPKAYEDPASSLFWKQRITTPHPTSPVPSDSEIKLLDIGDWPTFGGVPDDQSPGPGQMETLVHNVVHGFVGRDMASPSTSARDPIFWAHHANLDRIWLQWQIRWNQAPSQPDLALPGVDGLQGDWVDVSKKYTYGPMAGSAPFMFEPHRILAASAREPAFAAAESLKLTPVRERVLLKLTDVKYPESAGQFVNARIFLFPQDAEPEKMGKQFAQAHFLGYFTDWLVPHDHHGRAAHGRINRITLDVTARAVAIQSAAGDKPLVLSFELVGQDADGRQKPLRIGGSDGVTLTASLEVVRVEGGKLMLVQKVDTEVIE